MTSTSADTSIRDRLAIALDVDDLVAARRIALSVGEWFGVAKIGLGLFSAAGPEAIGVMKDLGFRVFLDLKFHDIPTTVNKASRVVGEYGVDYLTLHAHGGPDMLRAGVDGLMAGSDAAGFETPTALAVTVLTSDGDAPPHILPRRIMHAVEAGCRGIVCAASDARDARLMGPRLTIVVPGIRPKGTDHHDQSRAATPADAIAAGADVLVIGRAVTEAGDMAAAAAALHAELGGDEA